MGVKMIRDPEALQAELKAAHARNRELDKEINAISKERKVHVRVQQERDEAVERRDIAEDALEVANQRIDALEKELASEKSSREAERQIVENAQRLKAALEAL